MFCIGQITLIQYRNIYSKYHSQTVVNNIRQLLEVGRPGDHYASINPFPYDNYKSELILQDPQ